MKERPILFSAPMVRAILDGRKTQTRRIVKFTDAGHVKEPRGHRRWHPDDPSAVLACQYGQPGERLWVREAFHGYHWDKPRAVYRADGERQRVRTQIESYEVGRWTPSIHMPRWASRITLEIVSVRVERLQEISDADARSEGVDFGNITDALTGEIDRDACEAFETLWESINGSGSWEANPLVWVVEFKRVEQSS